MKTPPFFREAGSAKPIAKGSSDFVRAGLVARALCAGYPGRAVLSGIDLEIRPGEVLAIIGPNGAGKTTLLKTLAGELAPCSGGAFVTRRFAGASSEAERAEYPISSFTPALRARIIARVLQSEEPAWPLPVRDYVEAGTFSATGWFGSRGGAENSAVEEALVSMDLIELAQRPVTELSGGEFRRVLIARALAQRPAILLLDEPAADLDLARQMDTLGRLKGLAAEGRAVVFTVHDLNLAALAADRVALVAGGGLVAVGSPREVITVEAVSKAYGATVLVGDHPLGDFPQVIHAPVWLAGWSEELHG